MTVIEIKVLAAGVLRAGGGNLMKQCKVNKILNSTVPSTSKPSGNAITIKVTVIS